MRNLFKDLACITIGIIFVGLIVICVTLIETHLN